jgi:HEPN domain-containing protein
VNRIEWQKLAERWLDDAKTLLDNRRWSAAYYLAGYAVECGLKPCVLARVTNMPEVVLEDRRFSEKCWTHSVQDLVKQADLEASRLADARANPDLLKNWLVVKDWSERARYETKSHQSAKKLYAAITDNPNGVMKWIRIHW